MLNRLRWIGRNYLPGFVVNMVDDYHAIKGNRRFLKNQGFTKDKCVISSQYEKRYIQLIKEYKKVCFHMICATAMGTYGSSLSLMKMDQGRDEKHLHIFLPLPLTVDQEIFIPNQVMLEMFSEYNIVKDKEELDFWKYVYLYHKGKVVLKYFGQYHPGNYEYKHQKGVPYMELYQKLIIQFSSNQIKNAKKGVKALGIHTGYVCLFVRDNAYVSQRMKVFDYGAKIRNSSFDTYINAVELIKRESMQVVRMGQLVEQEIEYEGVIDFSKHYDELLDLYLFSQCAFFLGDMSGIISLPQLFHRPLAICNSWATMQSGDVFGPIFEDRDLFIPQKLYHKKKQRYLSFKEQLQLEEAYGTSKEKIKEYGLRGIILVQNSSEEILDLADEMLDRVKGKHCYTKEEEKLQNKYRELLKEATDRNQFYYIRARIGSKFLQKNPWYLE